MLKLLGYLKQCKKSVLAIIVLLIVQAWCDLALPQYTSDIVDVGIQQGGIAWAAPEEMRNETWEALRFWMTEEEQQTAESYYEQKEDGIWVRTADGEKALEEIQNALRIPMVLVSRQQEAMQQAPETADQMQNMQEMGRDQVLALRETALESAGGISDSMLNQIAISFVKAEYQAMGKDLGSIQTGYLLMTGAKMLGFTLVMMAAAILISFLASRAAASIGRNLRQRVFERVMSFSSGEMHQFSTASLITRSTNDIQQVQMVSVMLLRMIIYAPILGIGGIIKDF